MMSDHGWLRRRIETDSCTREADKFRRSFRVEEGADYQWVYEYTIGEVQRLKSTIGELDDKADSLVRYVGALSGGIAVLSALAGGRTEGWLFLVVVPALVCMLIALTKAISVRAPDEIPFAPTPADALRYAGHWKDANVARADFSALLHWHRTRLWLAINLKGTRIRAATTWFVLGLWLLLLPIVLCVVCALVA